MTYRALGRQRLHLAVVVSLPFSCHTAFMPIIKSRLETNSDGFAANKLYMTALVTELRDHLQKVRLGGGPDAIAKHRARGKMLARERVERLVDAVDLLPRIIRISSLGRLRR